MSSRDYSDAYLSYFTSGLAGFAAWLGEVNWMAVGAGVLLVARLVKDVPEAYESLAVRYKLWKAKK